MEQDETRGPRRYIEPDAFARRVLNPAIHRLTAWGLGVKGSRILEVPGRVSGEIRTTVVNLLTVDGQRYLVSPRGHTQWSRNLRAASSGTLRLGRRRETFAAVELADVDKPDVIRAYLEAWAWEVGRFVEGLTATSTDDEILAVAAGLPVFRIEPTNPDTARASQER